MTPVRTSTTNQEEVRSESSAAQVGQIPADQSEPLGCSQSEGRTTPPKLKLIKIKQINETRISSTELNDILAAAAVFLNII